MAGSDYHHGVQPVLDELAAGPDTCSGRWDGNTTDGYCGRRATVITLCFTGRGDWYSSACPLCGPDSYRVAEMTAVWDGTGWLSTGAGDDRALTSFVAQYLEAAGVTSDVSVEVDRYKAVMRVEDRDGEYRTDRYVFRAWRDGLPA